MSKGRHLSPETRAKISESMKRRYLNPENRAKLGEAMRGKSHSPETRAKLSEIMKRKKMGSAHPNWKGGRAKDKGYIRVWKPSHPRASKNGYVLEHILAWEQSHGRQLPQDYVVHHINGVRDDNRPVNLLACPRGNHHYALLLQELRSRIRELEAELRKFKTQGKLWGDD